VLLGNHGIPLFESAASWKLFRADGQSKIADTRMCLDDVGWRAGADQVFPRQPR